MVTQFRNIRLYCQISLKEVAEAAKISTQRINRIEMGNYGYKAQNPERLICALESVIRSRKLALEKAEHICRHSRNVMFAPCGKEKLL